MILFIKGINKLITAVEGTGDNLLDEDIAEGLKDYMMTSIYKVDGEDVELEDGQVVISRRITESRSINKINGTSVPVSVIRQVAALCIDIHGQHEHQSLLHKDKQYL